LDEGQQEGSIAAFLQARGAPEPPLPPSLLGEVMDEAGRQGAIVVRARGGGVLRGRESPVLEAMHETAEGVLMLVKMGPRAGRARGEGRGSDLQPRRGGQLGDEVRDCRVLDRVPGVVSGPHRLQQRVIPYVLGLRLPRALPRHVGEEFSQPLGPRHVGRPPPIRVQA
jgi:hypothetical protein